MDITKLQICSYNCRGLGAGKSQFMQNLCDRLHFIFIQEHWPHDSNSHWFDNNIRNIHSHIVSGMSSNEIMQGRPYGGTAILLRDNLRAMVEPVITHCLSLWAVRATINKPCFLLCSAYLPSKPDRNTNILEEYAEVLNGVSVVLADTDSDFVIFGGDLNTDFCRVDLRSVHLLNSMLTRESLQKIDSCLIDFTFKR